MCGRFVSSSSADEIARYFDADQVSEQAVGKDANYNTAPTSDVFVVYSDGTVRNLDTFHWGLIPSWAKDLKIGNKLINARAETVAEKPSFRSAFKRKRCIVPVDGFYEWAKVEGEGKKKQPYFVERPDAEPYAFAGLWEEWTGSLAAEGADGVEPEEITIRSTTIITGPANEKMSEIHHRMPVILPSDSWDEWLDPSQQDTDRVRALLVPTPRELITLHPVSTEVNNVRNKGEHLIEAIEVEGVADGHPDAGSGGPEPQSPGSP